MQVPKGMSGSLCAYARELGWPKELKLRANWGGRCKYL